MPAFEKGMAMKGEEILRKLLITRKSQHLKILLKHLIKPVICFQKYSMFSLPRLLQIQMIHFRKLKWKYLLNLQLSMMK